MASPLRKPEYFWPLLWGALSIVLVVVLALEFAFGRVGADEGPRPPAVVAEARLLPPFVLAPDPPTGLETTARPLFSPGRRPAPPAVVADVAVMKKGQFVLQGTTVVGTQAMAFLKEVSTGRIHRVQKGSKVLDLTLSEISPNHVVLTLGGDSETVSLLVAKGPQASAGAQSAGPFPGGGASPSPSFAPAPAPGASPGSPAARPAAAPANPAAAGQPPNADANLTPEELMARRRAARRGQATN